AEGAAMSAALGNFHVSVMFRREADSLCRRQVHIGIMRVGQMLMYRRHHFIGGVRAGNGEHFWMRLFHHIALRTETTGDDHLAVFRQRLTDRIQRFFHRAIDEAASVHHHQIGILITAGNQIPLGAQAGEDVFRIHSRFRTTERDEADFGKVIGFTHDKLSLLIRTQGVGPILSKKCPTQSARLAPACRAMWYVCAIRESGQQPPRKSCSPPPKPIKSGRHFAWTSKRNKPARRPTMWPGWTPD